MAGTLADFSRATGIRVVTRAQWGARAPKTRRTISLPSARLWIHHTADDRQGESIDEHQDFHMDVRGWSDIAYSLLVDNNGVVYEGRGIGVAGGHTAGDNTQSHAICLLGNFENRTPPKAMQDTVVALARFGHVAGWWIPTMGGHRDAPGANTACPGRHAYALLPELRKRAAGPIPKPPPEDELTPEESDYLRRIAHAVIPFYQKQLADAGKSDGRFQVQPLIRDVLKEDAFEALLAKTVHKAVADVFAFAAGAKEGPIHDVIRQALGDEPAPPS